MANGWVFGLGVTLVFCARYFIPAMPRTASGSGIAIGLLIVISEMADKSIKPPFSAIVFAAAAILCAAVAVHLYWNRPIENVDTPPSAVPIPPAISNPVTTVASATREFTNKTIRQLKEIYEGRTALQAQPFMADEINKWIDTEGRILRIDPGMALLQNGSDHIECRFEATWNPKLGAFRHDEVLKVRGRINPQQNGAQIYLLDCEIRS